MECEKYAELISRSIDGDLSSAEEEELNRHLESCADCRSLLKDLKDIRGFGFELSEPPDGLKEKIMAKIKHEKARTRFKPRTYAALAAAVAVIFIAAYGVYQSGNGRIFGNRETAQMVTAAEAPLASTFSAKKALEDGISTDNAEVRTAEAMPAPAANPPELVKPKEEVSADTEQQDSSAGSGTDVVTVPPPAASMNIFSITGTSQTAPVLPYSDKFSAILVISGDIPEELSSYEIEKGSESETYIKAPSKVIEAAYTSSVNKGVDCSIYRNEPNTSPDAEYGIAVIYQN